MSFVTYMLPGAICVPMCENRLSNRWPKKTDTYPVRVILHVSSGALFTFDSVKFEGLAKGHSASLLAKWTLKPGAPYDTAYVNKFMFDEILSAPWAPYSKTKGSSASPCARIDEASKKVSVHDNSASVKETLYG